MGRIYSVTMPAAGATVTAAGGDADLIELSPGDDHPIRLLGYTLGNKTEVAEAQEEMAIITVKRLPATVTSSNGTSVTPVPMDSGDPAASFTAKYNGATVATSTGTVVICDEIAWNERATPYDRMYFHPSLGAIGPYARQGETLVIRLESTLADDMTMAMTAWVEEF